ncbi:Fe-S protein assembly co-chaperone HscB [Candidozyma auris]|nr:Fe-S_protein_assembly_co-chaperone_HscB [[Candida] auris]PIS55550.1 Fe-S protein assembly co-chaperone HscB [[Candida] auris]PIS56408.1 Fe-S protein assembly co-chaperone HscB [[Candida] auris]QEO19345.1 Fe-S_protein_assembly_co-chaperone_HscB [[Candida] auris]
MWRFTRWPHALQSRLMLGGARQYATHVKNYFELYPRTFPNGGPPKDSFIINERQLRREHRGLQSENHPDIIVGSASIQNSNGEKATSDNQISSLLNSAYSTIRNPYTRAAYLVRTQHPEKLDITQDEVSKELIAKFQEQSSEYSLDYKMLLMTVLEAHESLEMAATEADLEPLSAENDERIRESEEKLDKLFRTEPIHWNAILIETIRLKYWMNIANGIKEWEPGKPVLLTH